MTVSEAGRYWESTAPGRGRRKPRADAVTDARTMSLNGRWRFRLSPHAEGTGDAFVGADFDDGAWDDMRVPSHWVLEEFTPLAGGRRRSMRGTPEGPLYTNTALPIPLDPPRVGAENPTGDYRIVFDVPADWGESVLRFQGVDSCAKVWLNGRELGWSQGSRMPFEFDAPTLPGRNVLAVRVHRWSSGTYLEDQDMWWLPGIFRDVELIERRPGSIDDHFVHADYDPLTGIGRLRVDATVPAVVEVPELGLQIASGESIEVAVEPWSAEVPRLYRGSLRAAGESVELAIGFRRVEIVDGVFTVNGGAVTFRGVNRHEHHPDTGRALDRATMVRDIVMMKRANIDAVRTSHYPPHPEFLRLCDEYGLWVVLECDLETHGFIYDGWERNPPAVPEWRDALMDRLRRTVERDKNHPSIVVWSLANESGSGATFSVMREWLRERDPSRPVLYEREPSYRDSDFYSLMYPSLDELECIGRREELAPPGITAEEDRRRRALPFLLVEYAHAMGNGPGSLQDYERIMRSHDRICGGFVWEWIDHGFHGVADDGTPIILQSEDIDYEPRGGRFTLHGLVFSDRTPTPGLVELTKAYEPVRIWFERSTRHAESTDITAIVIDNRRHSADTADLRFSWRLEHDGITIASGVLPVPVLAPGGRVSVAAPASASPLDARAVAPRGPIVLTVEALIARDVAWAAAGHRVSWGQWDFGEGAERQSPPSSHTIVGATGRCVGTSGSERDSAGAIEIGDAVFDAATGRLVKLGGVEFAGPWLDVHRAPIENDHGQGSLNDIASVWSATAINRMQHRTDLISHGVDDGLGWLRVTGRTGPRSHPHGVEWTMKWSEQPIPGGRALNLDVDVDFTGPWADTPYLHRDIWVPRVGLLFDAPRDYEHVEWFGRGPGETYIDSYEGSMLGRYRSTIDELQTPYPVPQENGNHVQTRWLRLAGGGMPELQVVGRPEFDFAARRWTSVELERARKQHELRDSGHVWLNIDHRQQGIGSASVGPALPERYRVPRTRTAWSLQLSVRA